MLILLPVDGSERSLDAVRHALRLVREGLQASFVLANVQEKTHLYEIVLAHDADIVERASLEAGVHALRTAEALLKPAGVSYQTEVSIGDPAQTLIEIAESTGCDAIIMGTHGKSPLQSALMGSVSQTVLHGASVPVTIVKHADPEADADDGETPLEAEFKRDDDAL